MTVELCAASCGQLYRHNGVNINKGLRRFLQPRTYCRLITMRLPIAAVFSLAAVAAASSYSTNSTYINPVLPGWHSDPSCTYVADHKKLFCTVSTFLTFPGIPVYYSEDFLDWKHASNAFTRPSQAPLLSNTTFQSQNDGLWAPTIRYRNGTFYVITSYVSIQPTFTARGLLFKSTNPFEEDSWGDPVEFEIGDIDPDLYWDDDGTAYVSYAGLSQQTLDLETGLRGEQYRIWNGSGGRLPEGPHIYKKDGYWYLLAGEGGTELGHQVTIARSTVGPAGPYESYSGNPILTNKNTTEYFQTVGHADLFQDANGKWWGACLATRSGPAWVNYPMGREFVLFPVTWNEGEWPILEPVRGRMNGWSLPSPAANSSVITGPDVFDFESGSSLPSPFVFWRFPPKGAFTVSPKDHPSSLQIIPSQSNLTGSLDVPSEIAFIGRRQTHTKFTLTVDLDFRPKAADEEAGITLFLTQYQHIDLALTRSDASNGSTSGLFLRSQTTAIGKPDQPVPDTIVHPLPDAWQGCPVRLSVQAVNETHYHLTAASVDHASEILDFGFAPATILSGGTGPFTGTLLGMYATSNGGAGRTPAYFGRWRYRGEAQQIDKDGVYA
ncbi:hypothetical protein KVT40_006316 [Elsinoe batatas]|uniref:Beta-xylosidase C-terminal Concanavalin A-like domain-containing protein n=1 Tax=Elsinoe batatas TaxID=2601811 RepID=A0A8K0L1U4_9PEZI|nr:hypothetical protein KVT40_006316 [Elsinoe batatas]